jgi:transposase
LGDIVQKTPKRIVRGDNLKSHLDIFALGYEGTRYGTVKLAAWFVELKSETQLNMQTLHRARDRLVGERTALINQLRAILLERGRTVPQGRYKLEQYLAAMPDPESDVTLSPRMRRLVEVPAGL